MAYSELANWDGSVNNRQKRISPKRDDANSKRGPLDRDKGPDREIVRYGRSGGNARVRAQPAGGGATINGAGTPTGGGHEEVPMVGSVGVHDQRQSASIVGRLLSSEDSRDKQVESLRSERAGGTSPATILPSGHTMVTTDRHVASSASTDPKDTAKGLRTYLSRTKKPVLPPLRDGSLSPALLDFDEETVDTSSDQDSSAKVEDLPTVGDSFSPGTVKRHKVGRGKSAADNHGDRSSAAFDDPEDLTLQYPEPEPESDEVVAKTKADPSPSPTRKLVFDCVLIPSLVHSRELYKSVNGLYPSSRKRIETQGGERGSELKQPSKKKEVRNTSSSGRAARDVIYVSSSSDVPVAKPSVVARTYSSRSAQSKDPRPNHSKARVGGKGTEPRDPEIIYIDSETDRELVAPTAVTTSTSGLSKADASRKSEAHVSAHAKRETKVKESKRAKPVTVLKNPFDFGSDISASGHAHSQPRRLGSMSPVLSLPQASPASEEQEVFPELPEVQSESVAQTVRELIQRPEDELIMVSAGDKTVEYLTDENNAPPDRQQPIEDDIIAQIPPVPAVKPALTIEDESPIVPADRHISDVSRRSSSPTTFKSKDPRRSSPGPSTHSFSVPLLRPNKQSAAVKKSKGQDKEKRGSDPNETEWVQSDDDIEEDVPCHSCRIRNVYAKMKCTNVVNGWVCPLYFCHKCIIVKYPEIDFDPYSVMFLCPRCDNTCVCSTCKGRRGSPQNNRIFRRDIDVPLLLSEQATLRQERYGSLSASAVHQLRDNSSRAGSRKAEKMKVESDKDVNGANWISTRNRLRAKAGKPPGRPFIGEWQNAWGPPPVALDKMDGVDLDVHGVVGKGKGKAIDPYVRLYSGDIQTLRRPHSRAADVYLPATKLRLRKKSAKVRKLDDSIEYNESDMPKKKKTRKSKKGSHVPEFTLNHQESEAPSASSSRQLLTPDDFPIRGLVPDSGSQTLQYMLADPIPDVLGHCHDQDVSNDDPYDAFGFDWERFQGPDIATKPYSYASYDDPSFSYQEIYESYPSVLDSAAGLGLRGETDMAPGYNYGSSAPFLTSELGRRGGDDKMDLHSATSRDPLLHVPSASADPTGFSLDLIDPVLLGEGAPTIVEHGNDYPPSPPSGSGPEDYSRFLRQNANSSLHEAGPFINDAPGTMVLSKEDLERAVRIALETLALPRGAPSRTVGYSI